MTQTTDRRLNSGVIFDRQAFNKLPGGINWRRKEDQDFLTALPMKEFVETIKKEATHG